MCINIIWQVDLLSLRCIFNNRDELHELHLTKVKTKQSKSRTTVAKFSVKCDVDMRVSLYFILVLIGIGMIQDMGKPWEEALKEDYPEWNFTDIVEEWRLKAGLPDMLTCNSSPAYNRVGYSSIRHTFGMCMH